METNVVPTAQQDRQVQNNYDLGYCVFYATHGELRSKQTNQKIHLERKVSQVFKCLAEANGQVVTREEIFDKVWPNVIVSDDSLNRCISVLRKVLKAFDHGLSIQTHPKIGFNLNLPPGMEVSNHEQINSNGSNAPETSNEHQTNALNTESLLQLDEPLTSDKSALLSPIQQGFPLFRILTLLTLLIAASVWSWYKTTNSTNPATKPEPLKLNEQRVVVMPFHFPKDLKNKYQELEYSYRQLITNHPMHNSISLGELKDIPQTKAQEIGKKFNARFVIKGTAYSENQREILQWQIIDAQTGDEVLNENLNMALNPNNINARILAADFVSTTAKLCFTDDISAQMQYIVDSANYLFLPHNGQNFHRPVINLLAQAITYIDPESVIALKTLAKLLTSMIGPSKDHNLTYLNLAINTLNKAIDLSPYQAELYQMLAHIYVLKYQWQDAFLILLSGKNTLSLKENTDKVNDLELREYTGYFSGELTAHYKNNYNTNPLNANNALKLISIYLKQEDITPVLQIVSHLNIRNNDWGTTGAELGPVLLRQGQYEKGRVITQVGFKSYGMSEENSNILIKGIVDNTYIEEASKLLTDAANKSQFSQATLLRAYAELGDITNYYALAFSLIDSYQFDILTSMSANSNELRQNPLFIPLMKEIGLHSYWLEHGLPDFCNKSINELCLSNN